MNKLILQRHICATGLRKFANMSSSVDQAVFSVDFEVHGKVQGVFFRKYTQSQANTLGVKGWIRNTSRGTVEGQLQGPLENVSKMKTWLQNTGSPKSKIKEAVFENEKSVSSYAFNGFNILPTK